MIKIPLNSYFSELTPGERASCRNVYKSARRAGFSINEAREMINRFVQAEAERVQESWDTYSRDLPLPEPDQLEMRLIRTLENPLLDAGILLLCAAVVGYVLVHILWAISR